MDTLEEFRDMAIRNIIAKLNRCEADKAALIEALEKAADMITSEYCSHNGECSATEKACYAQFCYTAIALAQVEGKETR